MKNLLRFLLSLLILIPLGMILMIRFTSTTIKSEGDGKIIFGYDQEKQHFQINEYKTYKLDIELI